MGRRYAAVLGLLAFAAVLVRGIAVGAAVESTLPQAIVCLMAFAIFGSIGGWLAGWIVEDSIRARMSAELTGRPEPSGNRPADKQ